MIRQYIKALLEARWEIPDLDDYENAEFEEYYDDPPDKETIKAAKKRGDLYSGKNVIWIGEKGRMLQVPASELTPREDNIFDWNKMAAVKKHILQSDEPVYFEAPIAQVSVVDLTNIEETQKAYLDGRFDTDYSNLTEPFSTGDEELDLYLANPEAWHEEKFFAWLDFDEYSLFIKDRKEWLNSWSYDENPSEWTDKEKEQYEEMLEAVQEHKRVQQEIKEAVENEDGDIGSYWVDLRDGNHRAFGAIAAGEPYVWVYAIEQRTDKKVKLE